MARFSKAELPWVIGAGCAGIFFIVGAFLAVAYGKRKDLDTPIRDAYIFGGFFGMPALGFVMGYLSTLAYQKYQQASQRSQHPEQASLLLNECRVVPQQTNLGAVAPSIHS